MADPVHQQAAEENVDIAERNREHFNKVAPTVETVWGPLLKFVVTELRANANWIGISSSSSSPPTKPFRIIDYACASGNCSRAFAPWATHLLGIDVSEGMIEQFNTSLAPELKKDFQHVEVVKGVVGDLLKGDAGMKGEGIFGSDEWWEVDMAVVGGALHHFEEPEKAVKRLAERLKTGGWVVIVEMVNKEGQEEEDHGHGHSHSHGDYHQHGHNHGHTIPVVEQSEELTKQSLKTIPHKVGFTQEETREMFENAGVSGEFGYLELPESPEIVFGGKKLNLPIYIAKGRKL